MVLQFKEGLQYQVNSPSEGIDSDSTYIPGTEEQSQSSLWHQERWSRITASTVQRVFSFGRRLITPDGKPQWEKFIAKILWNVGFNPTGDMKYGIQEEANALKKYESIKAVQTRPSGIWVNRNHPHLGASPDAIVADGGIVEIKCLKIFRGCSIQQVLADQENTPNIKSILFLCMVKFYVTQVHIITKFSSSLL